MDMLDGNRFFAYTIGVKGVIGLSEFIWADSFEHAFAKLRTVYPNRVISIRSAIYGEWDCDSFTLSGHTPHLD